MHDPEIHQVLPRLWLFAGTAEGPPLTAALLAMGWRVRLSLVSSAAGRAYEPHPNLELAIGAIGGKEAITKALEQAKASGHAFALVVDATHPFALTISTDLAAACGLCRLNLMRLHRQWQGPPAAKSSVTELARLDDLRDISLSGENLLLALGHRQLSRAIALTPGACHHARLLPNAISLQVAMAAGLGAEQVGCLRPMLDPQADWSTSVEAALLRHWQISVILARASGGAPEACWRSLAEQLGLKLLLLQRPSMAQSGPELGLDALLLRALALLKSSAA